MVMFIDVSGSMLHNAVNMAKKNFFGADSDFSNERYDIMAFMIKSAMKSLMHQWMRRSNVDAYLVLFGATAMTFDLSCEDKAKLKGNDPDSLDEWVRDFMRKHGEPVANSSCGVANSSCGSTPISIGSPVSSYGTCFYEAIKCFENHAQGRAPMVSEACFLSDAEYGDGKEEQRKFLERVRLLFDVVRLQVVSPETCAPRVVSSIIPQDVPALVESINSSDSTPPVHLSTAALVLDAAEAVLEDAESVSKPLHVTFVKRRNESKTRRATHETLRTIESDVRVAATGAPAAPKLMSATAFRKCVKELERTALHRFTIRLVSGKNKVNGGSQTEEVNELTKHVLASVLAGVTAAMKTNGKTYKPEVVKKIANHTDTVTGWMRSGKKVGTDEARNTSYAVFGLLLDAAPDLLIPCVLDPLNDQFKLHWPNEDEILHPIKRTRQNAEKDDSAPTCPPVSPECPATPIPPSEPGSPMQIEEEDEEGANPSSPPLSPALTPVTPGPEEHRVPESLDMDIGGDNPNVSSDAEDDEDDEPLSKRLCV